MLDAALDNAMQWTRMFGIFLIALTTGTHGNGLTVRTFKGIPRLFEIQCSGTTLHPGVTVFSLKIFTLPEKTLQAKANPLKNNCFTFSEMSSCSIVKNDTRKSQLRILVSDLAEGEKRRYGCTTTSFDTDGDTGTSSWVLDVIHNTIAKTVTGQCVTFTEYSSCFLDRGDTRRSSVRVLVSDMRGGEARGFGCRVNSFDSFGDTLTANWTVTVTRRSK
ncbi:hypothetical protein ACOMHN_036806 [Nucella lapillus]